MHSAARLTVLIGAALAPAALGSDTWQINMTVDNQFDAYVGTASQTTGSAVGTGNNWPTTYSFTVNNMQPTDYFYVATASDHKTAQGFLGEFNNTTQNLQFNTGSPVWEVFPVGAYLQQINPNWPSSWPAWQMPTQNEVDQALQWAVNNSGVWINPSTYPDWDNRSSGNITTWGHRPGIDTGAEWVWNNVTGGNPFNPGHNHDEFLVFRVRGVPAPGPLALLGLGGLAAIRRRR